MDISLTVSEKRIYGLINGYMCLWANMLTYMYFWTSTSMHIIPLLNPWYFS
jgi:hypothetical protein